MNAIKILAETKDTVTVSREDLKRLMAALEDAEDRAAVAERHAHERTIGKDLARQSYLTGDEARRLLDGENPVRVWREKRGLTQRALAAAAGVAPSYLAEIERGRKPGSADALSRLAGVLRVKMEDLMSEQQRRREPEFGPVLLRWRPHSFGVSEGRRSPKPLEQEFATLAEALGEAKQQWSSLRNQQPEIADEARLPIFSTEDLFGSMEARHWTAQQSLEMLGIGFDDDAQWSARLGSYVMWATTPDGALIRCRIDRGVFFDCLDNPHPTAADIKKMFQRHRPTFEKAFRNAIRCNLLASWTDPQTGEQRQEAVLMVSNFASLAGP
jgi:transcriptional regulator with XRE-family HTH domain